MQATLENEGSEAVKKLKAAAKTEKELRHQLGKVRFAAKEFEDSYNLIYRTREEALAKVRKAWLFLGFKMLAGVTCYMQRPSTLLQRLYTFCSI